MSTAVAIGAPGAASVIGGIGPPVARLCGGLNLLAQSRFEFGVDQTAWLPAGAGGLVAQVTTLYDPTSIGGRMVLGVRDALTTAGGYARGLCDTGETLAGETFVFTCWVKAIGSDLVNANIRMRDLTSSESIGSGDGKPGAMVEDEWVFFARVFTWATSTQTQFYVDCFPEFSPGSATGTFVIAKPRCHRVLSVENDLPEWPLRDWDFEPWLRTEAARDMFGSVEISRRGWIPRISARHPVISKTQLDAVSNVYSHDGIVHFEPNTDAEITFWMQTERDAWSYRHLADRAIGYSGRLELVGVDPVYGIPDATLYLEEENLVYYGIPRYVRAL